MTNPADLVKELRNAASDLLALGPQFGAIAKAMNEAAAALESTQAREKKLDLALQSLTPGGSEYVNDPERCVAYVRSVRESQHNTLVKALMEKKATREVGDIYREDALRQKQLRDAADSSLAAAKERLATLRNEVLEEAAKIADDYGRDGLLTKAYECETADELAARIRALKTAGKE